MPHPKVSVIVPVYNCRNSLERCVGSVLAQTLSDLELICVDDGSTDGSLELLRKVEDPRMTVLAQPNSGGPGAPRNAGLDRATGEFVMFVDADDWLGPRALELMVAMAEDNDTDIVIGKYVGVGRKVPVRLFRQTVARTTIYDDRPDLYATLAPLKLFRRGLIGDTRFPEGLKSHEDQEFTALAYFKAKAVSVLADYDAYFWVEREDGSSVMQQGGAPDEAFFPVIGRVMRLVEAHTEPGNARNRMLRRHFREEVMSRFGRAYLDASAESRALTEAFARDLMERHLTPEITAASAPFFRQLAHCLLHGRADLLPEIVAFRTAADADEVVVPLKVVAGRVYQDTPGFGDLPDACFDVSDRVPFRVALTRAEWEGSALVLEGDVELPGGVPTDFSVVVRDRGDEPVEYPFAVASEQPFRVVMDFAETTLAKGRWDVVVKASLDGVPLAARPSLGDLEVPGDRYVPVSDGKPVVRGHVTDYGNLSVDAGWQSKTPEWPASAKVVGGALEVAGSLPASTPVKIVARLRGTEEVVETPALFAHDAFTATLPLKRMRDGVWQIEFEVGGMRGGFLPDALASGRVGLRRTARPYRTSGGRIAATLAPAPPVLPRLLAKAGLRGKP
ncbi:glycosyltransferase family 2 protein [Actinocorallia sp. A-T 12471]|uniref:glycosyltransferase family 2 protein n=1 Tax=Actinocorallia sp. A-T 12471 TaxID=3089813 RepID=UPI0029D17836|nr:glycosyltransferase family 2 protein [Actinocorallia sp. A-T 12471]MDX6744642.1 glycosyltransferase family 2 protein [Actinocorallia sp. A-T 12471]